MLHFECHGMCIKIQRETTRISSKKKFSFQTKLLPITSQTSRPSLGVLPSTPVAFLQAEGGSVPARARLDRRQGAFAIRLASSTSGPHTGLLRTATGSGLGHRLREWAGPEVLGQKIESSRISMGISFPGCVELPPVLGGEEKEEAVRADIEKARERRSGAQVRYRRIARSWRM